MSESKGVYLDRETGKLTRSKPARAKVLVRPGDDIPAGVQELLDAKETAKAPVSEVATAPEAAEIPKPASKPAKRTSKG